MKRKHRTNIEFIKDCNIIHNNYYNYRETIYTKMSNKVVITCPVHGNFKQLATHHIRGKGCAKCAFDKNKILQKSDTKSFVENALKIHGNVYNYSKVIYGKNAHEKITLICKEHGEFKVSPNAHLNKRTGCRRCGELRTGWTKTL